MALCVAGAGLALNPNVLLYNSMFEYWGINVVRKGVEKMLRGESTWLGSGATQAINAYQRSGRMAILLSILLVCAYAEIRNDRGRPG